MSVQFGRWNFDGQPVDPEYIAKVNALLAPYAPDGCSSHSASGVTVLYHAFHTTKESRREKQPHISNSGAVITWDGRLDNRKELIRELAHVLTAESTDVEIAAAAYEEWGEESFAKLIGDWALAIWNPATRSLILAKDVIGTRHLYYAAQESRITWSTLLDPLVLLAGHKFQLCEEYIAGWLGFFPATHLTPYVGIDSVPPSCFVRLQRGKREIRKYWDFDPHKRILYRTDAEYEEHFRIVFAEAVRRRLRSDSPVLAELSGGMDSSSIVCMADEIIAGGMAEAPRLDTISYYDDSEPNWNERPFFLTVERTRGRVGCHIDASEDDRLPATSADDRFASTPSALRHHTKASRLFADCVKTQGNSVILSGTGGDEALGGVATAIPELADLIARAQFIALARQLKNWAISRRQPWSHLVQETLREFLPPDFYGAPQRLSLIPWLQRDFARRYHAALAGYRSRVKLFGSLPSFQENLFALEGLRRQLACTPCHLEPLCETRYAYLDRSLLEFIYAIPRAQLVRPGQRRSLMRRALVGIVPHEILSRRRKAFVVRSPIKWLAENSVPIADVMQLFTKSWPDVIDPAILYKSLRSARVGCDRNIAVLTRSLLVGLWLEATAKRSIATNPERVTGSLASFVEKSSKEAKKRNQLADCCK